MNLKKERYAAFALCREMMETCDVMRRFEPQALRGLIELLDGADGFLLTGEGSSRIFPAKRARKEALESGGRLVPFIEGATQAGEYDLSSHAVLGASNSGRTREVVRLYRALKDRGHKRTGIVTAHAGSVLETTVERTHVLNCGAEQAVAASKSVVEQALAWQAVNSLAEGWNFPDRKEGAELFQDVLNMEAPEDCVRILTGANTLFFAGRNDGIAEELTLKTNEITRLRADYLEGTYAVHGIEEVLSGNDAVILIDPFEEEEKKFKECLEDGAGVPVLAIAERETLFPTFRIPSGGSWRDYAMLAAGWNLLVEIGIRRNVNLDKTERARKVGNEV